MKHPLLFLALVALVAGSGCVNREAQAQGKRTQEIVQDQTVPIQVAAVTPRTVVRTLEVTGAMSNSDDTSLTALTAGRITAVFVKDGDTVSAGQIIARQETTDASTRLRQAQSQVNAARAALSQALNDARVGPERSAIGVRAARAQLAQSEAALLRLRNGSRREERAQAESQVNAANANLKATKADYDRAKNLLAEGAISQREFDQRQLAYETALAQYQGAVETANLVRTATRDEDIKQAEAGVRAARENLQNALAAQKSDVQYQDRVDAARANLATAEDGVALARQAIDDAVVRAPMSGRISGKPAQPGQYAGPGTPIARLIGMDGIYFEGDVPETDVTKLQPGMPVSVTLEALAGQTLNGRIAAINPAAQNLGRLFKVRVTLDSTPAELKTGMFARGRIEVGRQEDAILVPRQTVLRDGDKRYVYVRQGDKAVRREVKVLGEQDGQVQVSGLSAGEELVTTGQNLLTNGAKVRIEKES